MRPINLPSTVILPAAPMATASHIYSCLGASRQLVHLWRRHGFPAGHRDGRSRWLFIDDVAAWCERHGSKVRRS